MLTCPFVDAYLDFELISFFNPVVHCDVLVFYVAFRCWSTIRPGMFSCLFASFVPVNFSSFSTLEYSLLILVLLKELYTVWSFRSMSLWLSFFHAV